MRIQVKAAIRTDVMADTVPLCEFVPECVNDFETLALGRAVYKRMWKYGGKMDASTRPAASHSQDTAYLLCFFPEP